MTKFDVRQSPVVVKAIIQDVRLYQMEYKGHHNSLIYIILKLHTMGGKVVVPFTVSDEQLVKIYKHIIRQMNPLLISKEESSSSCTTKTSTCIHVNDWQDYLGDTEMYSAYLHFFDREITIHGVNHTLTQFFYNKTSPLAQSIGSQRLPTIHLSLGIQHGLSEVIAQALAYMATAYQDTSFLLLPSSSDELCNNGYLTAHEILMEQVRVDPRFSSFPLTPSLGYHDAQTHSADQLTYRKIIKNTKELLRTYVYLWRVPESIKEAIHELKILAAHMMLRRQNGKYNVDLTTGGGNLLNTLNAMEVLYPNNTCPMHLIRVLFLNLICSYIVQGRPDILAYSHHKLLKQQDKKKKKHQEESIAAAEKKKYTCPATCIYKLLEKKVQKKEHQDIIIQKIAALACIEQVMKHDMMNQKHHLFEKLTKTIYLQ